MNWISVRDRLPEQDQMVLTWSYDEIIAWGAIKHGVWSAIRDEYGQEITITHWMPLPEPPKDDNLETQARG